MLQVLVIYFNIKSESTICLMNIHMMMYGCCDKNTIYSMLKYWIMNLVTKWTDLFDYEILSYGPCPKHFYSILKCWVTDLGKLDSFYKEILSYGPWVRNMIDSIVKCWLMGHVSEKIITRYWNKVMHIVAWKKFAHWKVELLSY